MTTTNKKMTRLSVTFPLEGIAFEGEEDSEIELTPYIIDCTTATQKAVLQAIAKHQSAQLPFYIESCAIRMVMGVQSCKKETLNLTRIKVELVIILNGTTKKIQVVMKDTHPLTLPGDIWVTDPHSFLQKLGATIYTNIISAIDTDVGQHIALLQREAKVLQEGLENLERVLSQT